MKDLIAPLLLLIVISAALLLGYLKLVETGEKPEIRKKPEPTRTNRAL